MSWEYSLATHIWIFSVGRGSSAFVRTGLNQGFIIDMGGSGAEEFSPAAFIKKHIAPRLDKYQGHSIAQAVLSHPHKDHIAECAELQNGLAAKLLTCPHDKSKEEGVNWARIKNPNADELVNTYKSLYGSRNLPLQTIRFDSGRTIPNLEYGIYYIRPPKAEQLHADDNEYGNACSIMFYLRHGSQSILFPGDMTPEGMSHVLAERIGTEKRYSVLDRNFTANNPDWHEKTCDQPSLRSLLQNRGLSILVAPHHGLESCYSQELFDAMRGGKPQITVISERRHLHESDGCLHKMYQSELGSLGLPVELDGELQKNRKSVSTINGHHILIVFEGTGVPRIFANKDPEQLLAKTGGRGRGAVA